MTFIEYLVALITEVFATVNPCVKLFRSHGLRPVLIHSHNNNTNDQPSPSAHNSVKTNKSL